MAPKKQQIVTTETQLFAIMTKLADARTDADESAHEDIKDALAKLDEKVVTLDKSIRGNGAPGIKQELVLLRKDVDTHLDDCKQNAMSTRWKVGIILASILASIPAVAAFRQLLSMGDADEKIHTKALVLEIIRDVTRLPVELDPPNPDTP